MKQKVYTVFWVYIVSWVIKLKKLNELNKPNKLIKRNGLRYSNRLTCSLLYAICFTLLVLCGCATATTSTGKESLEPKEIKEAPVITSIEIQDYTVSITVNKPFIYTIYRPDDPYKIVVDLPDVDVGAFNSRIVSSKAGITEIVPSQVERPSLMSRLEILLEMPYKAEPEYKDNTLTIRIKEDPLKEALKEEVVVEEEIEVEEEMEEEIPFPKAKKPEEKIEAEVKEPEMPVGDRCKAYLEGKENINFDFQDQDIMPIFRLFADISGCNLFLHPDVKGRCTMKFKDVPWNQALDTILKTFSLDKSIEGNIIRIAPHRVFAEESAEATKAEKAKKAAEIELAPLERKTYRLVYANAEDVKQKLLGQKIFSKYDEQTKTTTYYYEYDEKLRILSGRGIATSDRISNVIVVEDIPYKIAQVDDFIKEIDQPTRQVLIEARIVEVNTNKEREFGIQWGINMQSTNTLMSGGGLSGVPLTSTGPFTGGNYLVDFPATGVGPLSGSGITFGIIDAARTIGLDVQLSALASVGSAKIVTNPKIMTMDRQQARIMQGKSIPVRKLTTEGTISTEFKDVAMELIVTPAITREQTLDLDIDIKKEELDPTIPSVEGVPGTDKKQAKTKVRIQDGETLVIGGLYKINTSDTEIGVPGLMKIPMLGWLFKREKKMSSTSELMIFITPRIVITERKP